MLCESFRILAVQPLLQRKRVFFEVPLSSNEQRSSLISHKTLKVLPETGKNVEKHFCVSEPDTLKMEKNCLKYITIIQKIRQSFA